ncbi:MAG: L-seryl-tRNA(Sec) selenium transferase, partial [Longimicrobiales bacterium]
AQGVADDVVPADGAVGGGAFPETRLAGFAVALPTGVGAAALDDALRRGDPSIVGRITADRLLLDVRTLPPDADAAVAAAVRAVVA